MNETFYKFLIVALWLPTIPYDIASAIEHYKSARYYRCGWFIMFTILGLMIIAKYLFIG